MKPLKLRSLTPTFLHCQRIRQQDFAVHAPREQHTGRTARRTPPRFTPRRWGNARAVTHTRIATTYMIKRGTGEKLKSKTFDILGSVFETRRSSKCTYIYRYLHIWIDKRNSRFVLHSVVQPLVGDSNSPSQYFPTISLLTGMCSRALLMVRAPEK